MFWLRNKKNNFRLRTLIWGHAALIAYCRKKTGEKATYAILRMLRLSFILNGMSVTEMKQFNKVKTIKAPFAHR